MKSLILSSEGSMEDIRFLLNSYIKQGFKIKILNLKRSIALESNVCVFKLKTNNPNLKTKLDEIYNIQVLPNI